YGFVVLLVLLPGRFIGVEGMGEAAAGTLMIALSAPLLILPIVAGRLTRWFRPATICGIGLLVSAAGLFWLSRVPIGAPVLALALPMLVIGTGISFPWGLMDGLAVSVVPTERAGMATGIFSTTRVAGEGVALAVVSAILSLLVADGLKGHAVPSTIATGAQRLAAGDLAAAGSALQGLDRSVLTSLYADAFASLLLLLTAITLLTALVVFVFLRTDAHAPDEAPIESAA
ncbi:MAG: MFS transporter, partial [Pararhizobium sp.]